MKAQELLNALPDQVNMYGYGDSLVKIEYMSDLMCFTYKSGYLAMRTHVRCKDPQPHDYWSVTANYNALAELCVFLNNP